MNKIFKINTMQTNEGHWADVLNWLQVVTDSCKTREQAETCERLIRNFHRMYEKKLGLREVFELTRKMELKLWEIGDWTLKEKLKLK